MSLHLYHYPPTPNNTKILVALAYKGIDFVPEVVDLRAGDVRETLVAATGQPLTPAIVHNGLKLCDSAAILRYLDLNFDGPALYSPNKETFREIDGWEHYNRNNIGALMGAVFGQLFADQTDPAVLDDLRERVHAASAKVEATLSQDGGRDWLVGEALTAADIVIGCTLAVFCFTDKQAAQFPLWKNAQACLDLGPDRRRCRAHAQRVMAYIA